MLNCFVAEIQDGRPVRGRITDDFSTVGWQDLAGLGRI
jgi:hypothetical protein